MAPIEPHLPAPQIRVENADWNDPTKGLPLDTTRFTHSPTYIRFEPDGDSPHWNVTDVFALVYTGEGSFVCSFLPPPEFEALRMGDPMGKVLYLTETFWQEKPRRIPERMQELIKQSTLAGALSRPVLPRRWGCRHTGRVRTRLLVSALVVVSVALSACTAAPGESSGSASPKAAATEAFTPILASVLAPPIPMPATDDRTHLAYYQPCVFGTADAGKRTAAGLLTGDVFRVGE